MSEFSGILTSGDAKIYVSEDKMLLSNFISDIDFAKREGMKEVKKESYSTIEGCIRQTMNLPIEKSGQH